MEKVPKKGFRGLVQNWRSDFIAAISVSLVAMPLALGIAKASGVAPISGILSAIIGGVVTTFFRGGYVSINGPAAGLIAVVLASIAALDDGSGRVLHYVFAAIVVAGFIQILLGLFKLGRFADLFHSTVIQGILAAIGVIIFAKQIHVTMGTSHESETIIGTVVAAFREIPNINPFVAVISLVGLVVLIFHSKIKLKAFQYLPAAMWVLILSIPFVYAFNFFEPHTESFFGKEFEVGPDLLINIPNNILDAIIFPDFSRIDSFPFWTSVISITMIASIESLASAKAIDKLDPYKRKTNLDKDLMGVGVSTMVSGALGGLPIIALPVRSTVNIHNNAKTKWSNLYHGILLLAFIFALTPFIQQVPLSALAILLVFIGYKLASPKIFKRYYSQGFQQFLFFAGTLVITLLTDLLVGIFGGLLLVLVTQLLTSGLGVRSYFRKIHKTGSELIEKEKGSILVKIKGVANFLSSMKMQKLLNSVPAGKKVNVDFSEAAYVDLSVIEDLTEFIRNYSEAKGEVLISGLSRKNCGSNFEESMKMLIDSENNLTARQQMLEDLTAVEDWSFLSHPEDSHEDFHDFHFFKSRSIINRLNSVYKQEESANWIISDVRIADDDYRSNEEHIATLGLLSFAFEIPKFRINKRTPIGNFLNFWKHKDHEYETIHDFSHDFIVKAENKKESKAFIDADFQTLVEENDVIHHLESNGEAILIFMENMQVARIDDYTKIVSFTEKLKELIMEKEVGLKAG